MPGYASVIHRFVPPPSGAAKYLTPARAKFADAMGSPPRAARAPWHIHPSPQACTRPFSPLGGFAAPWGDGMKVPPPRLAAPKSKPSPVRGTGISGCSLRYLYLNSSSSRAGHFLWINRFFTMLTGACVAPKGVGGRVFLLYAKVNNPARRRRPVDNWLLVPVKRTGLSTVWCEGDVKPPCSGAPRLMGGTVGRWWCGWRGVGRPVAQKCCA